MKTARSTLVFVAILASAGAVGAQTPAAPATTDVYHVMFTKAAPGQAAALAKDLQQPDPKDPMTSHFILLRHQEGADWDYCLIQHVGAKASVEFPRRRPPRELRQRGTRTLSLPVPRGPSSSGRWGSQEIRQAVRCSSSAYSGRSPDIASSSWTR